MQLRAGHFLSAIGWSCLDSCPPDMVVVHTTAQIRKLWPYTYVLNCPFDLYTYAAMLQEETQELMCRQGRVQASSFATTAADSRQTLHVTGVYKGPFPMPTQPGRS